MTTTPNPTCHELLADANLILRQSMVTQANASYWRHRYQQWLTQQNHPAAQPDDGDPDGYLKARGAIRGGEPAEVTIRRTRGDDEHPHPTQGATP